MGTWEGNRNCLVVSRQDRDHRRAASALAGYSDQEIGPRMGGEGAVYWQEGQGLPRPLLQRMVNGHCVWFPAVASSPARTLVFLPQPEASPLISKQQTVAWISVLRPVRESSGEGGEVGKRGRGEMRQTPEQGQGSDPPLPWFCRDAGWGSAERSSGPPL